MNEDEKIKKSKGRYWCSMCNNQKTTEYRFNSMCISLCVEHEKELVKLINPKPRKGYVIELDPSGVKDHLRLEQQIRRLRGDD